MSATVLRQRNISQAGDLGWQSSVCSDVDCGAKIRNAASWVEDTPRPWREAYLLGEGAGEANLFGDD